MSSLNIHKIESLAHSLLSNPYALSGAITTSYILFYTGYDKTEKTLVPSLLLDFFGIRKGWDWTLSELNKAISLSGLSIMLCSFLPHFISQQKELLLISLNILSIHSIYSMYKFYQYDITKVLKDKWIKRLSLGLGSACQFAIALGYTQYITPLIAAFSATTLGIGHFWTMEVDYKYQLQVRPFAYLVFPLSGYVFYTNLLQWFDKK